MPINHNLLDNQIQTVQNLVDQGQYSDAWQYLADQGDRYADNAADVTGQPDTIFGETMRTLVEQHWGKYSDPSMAS